MPTDLKEIITSAVNEADPGGGDETATESLIESSSATITQTPVAVAEEPVVEAKPKTEEVDEVAALLEAEGIKPSEKGQRDNRIPYARVKKIVDNARTKLTEAHTLALTERDGKLTSAEKELEAYRKADALAKSDPDRYLELLSVNYNPAFKKFLTPQTAQPTTPKAEVTTAALGPRPEPDAKFPDGSLGYSPEQHVKLLDWVAATAEARAVAHMEDAYNKRLGPMEQKWKAELAIQERMPVVRAQIQRAKERWGEHFKEDDPEVLAYMEKHPEIPFAEAIADVLLPRVRVDQNTMRTSLLKEINARPKAAVRTAPAAATAGKEVSNEPRTIDQVIRDAMATLK